MNLKLELKGARSVAIGGHERPDGDCIGSTMAIYLYIKKNMPGVDVHVYNETPQDIFKCIKDLDKIEDPKGVERSFDVFICVDCADERMPEGSRKLFEAAGKTINIDHHITNKGVGDVNYIDPESGSAAELVYDVLDRDGFDVEIAKALYIGIIHDTGVFQYSNVRPDTMIKGAELIKYGFDFTSIIDETFYEKGYLQTQIMGRALTESILMMDGKVCVSHIDLKTAGFYGAGPKDFDGIVNRIRYIKGVDVAIFMYELENHTYKVSMRSRAPIDVAAVAAYFGGGGHVRAAGVTMEGNYRDIINNLTREIAKQYD